MPTAVSTAPSSATRRSAFFILVLCLLACVGARAATADSSASGPGPIILVLGDSLSAAYGMRLDQGWVALLAGRLRAKGYGHRVVNASSSGETTGGGLARLPRALRTHRPAIVVVELGGNDGLRGLPVADIRRNLESIVTQSREAGARVLLVGMKIPPNYGPAYARQFEQVYADLAARDRLALVPFLLEAVALDENSMQADGIHPTVAAQPKLLDQVWPRLKPMLGEPH